MKTSWFFLRPSRCFCVLRGRYPLPPSICYIAADERPCRQAHRPRAVGRHRLLQVRGAVPGLHQGRRHRAGGDDRGGGAVHHAGHHAGAVGAHGLHLAVGRARAEQHAAHQPVARGRCHRHRAVQRRLHGAAGARARRRPAEPDVPGAADRPGAAAAGAGDEPRDVGASGHAAQHGAAGAGRRHHPGRGLGFQACGETGDGRMLEPPELLEDIVAFLQPKLLAGKRWWSRPGPTFEALDPIRGITNHSSGKMGFAIARAAREAGAEVTLVAGPGAPAHAARRAPRRRDLGAPDAGGDAGRHRQRRRLRRHGGGGRLAPGDRERAEDQEGRQRRRPRPSPSPRTPTSWPPWRRASARNSGALFCVGFAAESHDLLANAQAKRERKGIPLLAGNIGPLTFGQDDNQLLLVDEHGTRELPRAPSWSWRARWWPTSRAALPWTA
jgi:hypothetical protein